MEYSPSIGTQLLEAIMAKYVDRGDPATFDFTLGDLTLNDTWQDLDLSAIIPPAAAGHPVHLGVTLMATKANNCMQIRTKGNVNEINLMQEDTPAANVRGNKDALVTTDANRTIQYRGTLNDWTALNITVRGWIEE